MKKRTEEAFGKEVYLLGKDEYGILYWLCEPSFDCNWYWGFGYISSYTDNDNPKWARDICTHQHFQMFLDGIHGNFYVDAWKYFFNESTLSDEEVWHLMELMKTAYALKEMAAIYHRGGSNISKPICKKLLINTDKEKEINEILLPKIFEEIKKLLSE